MIDVHFVRDHIDEACCILVGGLISTRIWSRS